MTTTETGTITIPEAGSSIPATPQEDLDAAIREVAGRARAWAERSIPDRIALLDELLETATAVAEEWAATDIENKGIAEDSPLTGEGWSTGPLLVIRNLALLRTTLEQIRDTGRPQPPEVRMRPDGRVVVDVFPTDARERVVYAGFEGEVRLQPDVGLTEALERMGSMYRDGRGEDAGVCVVLGAGNVSAIPATDVLTKLFNENRVCVLKMNPVNETVGPALARAFEPLIREGYLRVVYGGAEVGSFLVEHDEADEVHITGSDKTHDVIVWGRGEEAERRRDEGDPRLGIPVTSELGNVTPVIVVPGPWSDDQISFHGDNIASMIVQNAGFNCITARMVVTHRDWSRRAALVAAIRSSLRRAEPRQAYYPGAEERWRTFTDAHSSHVEEYGGELEGTLPWTLLTDLDPDDTDEVAFNREAFCGLCGEVGLKAPRDVPAFVDRAVRFCNEQLWGTLAATIIVHPRSMRDPAIAAAVERGIDDLRYGNVVVNHWAGIPYAAMTMPWGAYPGHTPEEIGSGIGWVHNTFMLEGIEKGVLRGPFTMPMKPPWFHTHERLAEVSRASVEIEAEGSWRHVPELLWNALRG